MEYYTLFQDYLKVYEVSGIPLEKKWPEVDLKFIYDEANGSKYA